MNIPIWVWILLAVVVFALWMRHARRLYRTSLRADFIAFLSRAAPELEVVSENASSLAIRLESGEVGQLFLHNLYEEGIHAPKGDEEAREALFARFLSVVREGGEAVEEIDPARDRPRVFPRIVPASFLEEADRRADLDFLPSIALAVPDLAVVFVLDSEHSVTYLDHDSIEELGVSLEEAESLAMDNLRRTFAAEIVRRPFEDGSLSLVKSGDSHDAARLLLVPESLRENETLAAVIPDNDTLGLAPVPGDGDWSRLRELARAPTGKPLSPEPLLVTRKGLQAAPGEGRG